MFKMMFSIQNTNNAVLSSMKAMPQKDISSDGASSFSNARRGYCEVVPSTPETIQNKIAKKWFGNRDASQIASNRRVHEIGVGSLNASKRPFAFVNKNDKNSRVDALARVRGGGYVAPPKIRHRGGQSGVPVATTPINVPVIRSEHRIAHIPTMKPNGAPYRPFHVRVSATA
jgi:hypothetical protein